MYSQHIKVDGECAWTMRLACEGEGERFRSNPKVLLIKDGRLVFESGPAG